MPVRSETAWDGQGLRLVLDAPKGNILDTPMLEGLSNALKEGVRPQTKLVVFEGEGSHFSFGASVADHVRDKAPEMLRVFHGLFFELSRLAVPTAAVVRGQCLGGALELAAFCHFVFANPTAQFGQPEIRLGVFPPVAAVILPWKVGQAHADRIVLTGEPIDANHALQIGLVDEVGDDPFTLCDALAKRTILPKSASSLRHAARAVRRGLDSALLAELPLQEKAYIEELMSTPDANEGIAAFVEKRKPQWGKS